ncbi:MAG: xanthine dehydrogenase family protein molybdopterin-binding subunit, partial [Candidatus Dormibacteraeota bacterium]|nr:xanthine dehydrogenase family protein molybdopterin-binding subunit [Candidatus Dormibacteraeota bacterium]
MSVEHLPAAEEAPTRFGIGQAVRRLEDRRFLTGGGRYVDDITLHKQAHAAVVRSPHAHARILHVHTEAAAAAPGVACVLTGADVVSDGLNGFTPAVMPEDFGQPPGHRTRRPPLVADKARFAGDAVALVVADTPAQARDAADMVEVEYEPLPAVIDASRAAAEGAPQVHEDCPQGNQAWMLTFGSAAAADDAFAAAAHRVGLHLDNQRLTANSIEPRGAVGEYDSGTGDYTLHTSTQNPHGVRHELAAVLGVPETRLRVIGPDVGGGFGMKGNPYPEDALVLWASRRCGRPVKWIATRYESLLTDTGGRDMTAAAELAFDDDGRIRGLRVSTLSALGAYVGAVGLVPSLFAMRLMPGPYDVRAVHLTSRGIFTNTSPVNPYRGAGRPEATYVIERLLDAAAAKLDLDGAEIRRRNLVRPEAIPYRTATGYVYDSGDFPRLLEACLARADWDGFPARRSESERWGRRRGRAVSYFIEEAGVFNDRMELRFDPTGGVTIVAGTFSHGQGHVTTFTQMVHEWLGVPVESIRFLQGDTDQVPFG